MGNSRKVGLQASEVSPPRTTVQQLMGLYLVVAATVAIAWLLGSMSFSVIYVFFIMAGLFVVWKTRLKQIVDKNIDWHREYLYRKRALRQEETAEWLNFIFNRWWVFSAFTIEDLVKKRINERLLIVKPSFLDRIDLVTFTFGDSTPSIRNLKTFECTDGIRGFRPASWSNITQPPLGLPKMSQYQVVLEGDLAARCEDFRMVFRGRLGSGRVGLDFDVAVEGMHITGTLQLILHMSMDAPFPHVTKVTVSFKELPEVWFNVCVLKAIQMMEIPLVKRWIHINVMEGLTKALVDPGKIDIPIASVGPIISQQRKEKQTKTLAEGVLTIAIKGIPALDAGEDVMYTRLRVGKAKRQTHDVSATASWDDVCSFFVYDLTKDKLQVKSKCKRMLTTVTLEEHMLDLNSFPFQVRKIVDHEIINKDGSKLNLQMDFSPLPKIDLNGPEPVNVIQPAGVLYVCVHSAINVMASDTTGSSDPYCVVFCDRRRVMTTPYVAQTRNPTWEAHAEFFVKDFTQCNLSFYVFDWDGCVVIDDDFLGSANLSLSKQEPVVVHQMLALGYTKQGEGHVSDRQLGHINVSVIFRPVPSVERSERHRAPSAEPNNNFLYIEDPVSPGTFPKPGQGHQILEVPGEEAAQKWVAKPESDAQVEEIMADKIYIDMTIVQAEDLIAMDRNGYSDPFCEVKMNDTRLFKTSVKKKTLNPRWEETVTFEIDEEAGLVEIVLFDKDFFRNDFLGSVLLTLDQLKELSLKGTSEWFTLQRTTSGRLQLSCTVTTRDTVSTPSGRSSSGKSSRKSVTINTSRDSHSTTGRESMHQQPSVEDEVFAPASSSNASGTSPTPLVSDKSTTVTRQQPKTSTPHPTPMKESGVKLRRSASDVNMDRKSRSDSLNSFSAFNGVENMSAVQPDPSHSGLSPPDQAQLSAPHDKPTDIPIGEKLFNVMGKVLSLQGLKQKEIGRIYCKVRVQPPTGHHRLKLMSGSRVVAKSTLVSATKPVLNVPFEVDRGLGTSPDTMLFFDIKSEKKELLASRGYSLMSIFDGFGNDKIQKVLGLERGLQVEIFLQHSPPDPNLIHRNTGRLSALKRSIRRDKDKIH